MGERHRTGAGIGIVGRRSNNRDIGTAIFRLRARAEQPLRSEILALAQTAAEPLGFKPVVVMEGPVDSAVPDEMKTKFSLWYAKHCPM